MNKKIKIRYFIFMALWFLIYNSIDYNFTYGSNGRVISYVMLWGILLGYTLYKVIQIVK